MKLLAWNLNHQAARRQIPSWIAAAINEQAPDILVLTEFASLADAVLTVATAPLGAVRSLSPSSCPLEPPDIWLLDGPVPLVHQR